MEQRPEPFDPADAGAPEPVLPEPTRPRPVLPRPVLPEPVLPAGGVPLDPGDDAPFPARPPSPVDFGDGVRLSRRSMVLVVLVALVPVMAAIGVAILLSLGTGSPPTGTDRGQSVSDTGDSAADGTGDDNDPGKGDGKGDDKGADQGGGTGVTQTALDDAGDALRSAGVRRIGSVAAAWTWRDGDTETLVAVTRRVTRRNTNFSPRAVTLRVTTITDPQGRPKVLAESEDDGQVCAQGVEMKADVTPSAVRVRDLDADGSREVLAVWSHACGSDTQRRVTVLAGPSAYVLDGQGPLLAEPEPPRADWPDGYLDAATEALG